jgi:signal transduction histidine kinase
MSLTAIPRANLDEHGLAVLTNLESVIDQGITEIKEISNNLSPHVLTNFGLESAISSFINKINYAGGIHIDFHSNLKIERFGLTVESVLYRTACELINNTIKHAMASNIELRLSKVNNMLFLHYADNGIGFIYDEMKNPESKGMGYYNIFSRLQSINGSMDVETSPGNSFVADICVRLN